jgi:hypothetical protein
MSHGAAMPTRRSRSASSIVTGGNPMSVTCRTSSAVRPSRSRDFPIASSLGAPSLFTGIVSSIESRALSIGLPLSVKSGRPRLVDAVMPESAPPHRHQRRHNRWPGLGPNASQMDARDQVRRRQRGTDSAAPGRTPICSQARPSACSDSHRGVD